MYFSGWMMLVLISLMASLAAFLWGLRSRQFTSQDRARYLPLVDGLSAPPDRNPSDSGAEGYGMIAILIVGFAVLMAPIVLILCRLRG